MIRRTLLALSTVAICLPGIGCGQAGDISGLAPPESRDPVPQDAVLLSRFVHISDAQIPDEESPARLTALARGSVEAYRPHYAYVPHFVDGVVRAVNRSHVTEAPIDFAVHTGDAADNNQQNELEWFLSLMDGGEVDPTSGPDDRDPADIPEPNLDPHATFTAQGLYQQGLHGPLRSIPWYGVAGNHDRFAIGVFPIVDLFFTRYAPLPLDDYTGILVPDRLFPEGIRAWNPITPANPGFPPLLNVVELIESNPQRRYLSTVEWVQAHFTSPSEPPGHGFSADEPDRTWYSAMPVPGLRLIGLDSATPSDPQPRLVYSEGAISLAQLNFLLSELEAAQAAGDRVVVLTHHPSFDLDPVYGTALLPQTMHSVLNRYPCVALHLCGHTHRGLVFDREGYLEIVTGALMDYPHSGRIIELWLDGEELLIRYRDIDEASARVAPDAVHEGIFDDPFVELREEGRALSITYPPGR